MNIKINNWNESFENAQSRKTQNCQWVAMSNDLTCLAMKKIVRLGYPKSATVGWTFDILCRLTSQLHKDIRLDGTVLQRNGEPHTAETLSIVTDYPEEMFADSIPILIEFGLLDGDSSHWSGGSSRDAGTASHDGGMIPHHTGTSSHSSGAHVIKSDPVDIYDSTGQGIGIPSHDGGGSFHHDGMVFHHGGTEGKGREENGIEPKDSVHSASLQHPTFPVNRDPTPKDVLTVFDAIFERRVGIPYARTAGAREAKQASDVIKAVKKTNGDWQRIPNSIEAAFDDEWFSDKSSFGIFAGQFQKFDMAAQGVGKKKNIAEWAIESGVMDPLDWGDGE